MKKRLLFGLLILVLTVVLYSCSHMTMGVGLNFGAGPYGVGVTPSFNVGFSGGYYW